MGRDYAPRNPRPASRKKGAGRAGLSGGMGLALGLAAGLSVAAWLALRKPEPAPVAAPAKPAVVEASRPEPVVIPPREKPRFTFYELLPSQEVVIPGEDEPPPGTRAAAQAAQADGVYLIQVASYRDETEANQQKAQLALLGIEARVESVTIDNRDRYFRVRIGPERELAKAQAILDQLQANGLQGLLVRVK